MPWPARTAAAAAPAGAGGRGGGERPAYFATGWTNGHNPWAIALVVTMATFAVVFSQSWILVPLTYGFLARVAERTAERWPAP